MNKTIHKKKAGKSVLSLVLVMLMLFSVIPFSAGATVAVDSTTTGGNTASPDPYPDQVAPTTDYPSAGQEGYVQLTKSATWSKDGTSTNLDTSKNQGYVTLTTYGTPIGGDAGVNVVLVCDTSGSMAWDLDKNSGTSRERNLLLMSSGLLFLNTIFKETAGVANNNRVAIVPFAGDTVQPNTITGYSGFKGASKQPELEASINSLPYSGGTDFKVPLTYAKTLIQGDMTATGNSGDNYVVLFMTDGQASDASSEAQALKNMGVTIYSIGMGTSQNISETYQTVLRNIASVKDGETLFYMEGEAEKFEKIYTGIAGELTLAATDVTITDKINTDKFVYDSARDILVDGNPITSADNVTVSGGTVTWKLDSVNSSAKTLQIPIKVTSDWTGVEYTNADLGDRDKKSDRATIEYTNYQGNRARKVVESPTLARPWAGITVTYFEVNASGNAVDDTGSSSGITDEASFLARYHSVYTESFIQQIGTTENYEALSVIKGNNGKYYKFVPSVRYSDANPKTITVNDNNEQHQIFFGVVEIDAANVALSKTYSPSLPSGVKASSFTFTNIGDSSDMQTWDAASAGSVDLVPQAIYKVSEQAAVGYKKITDFNVMYDAGSNSLKVVNVNGNSATAPTGVTINGIAIAFVNEKDASVTKDVSYQVRYYTTDGVKEEFATVNAKIWVHDTTIPVNASDIDLTNRFTGYTCDITAADLPPTVSVTNGLVEVPHSADNSKTKKASYYVEYYKDSALTKKDTVTKDVWVNATDIDVDASAINTADYYGVGYKLDKIDPSAIPVKIVIGETIKVYYITDTGATKTIQYSIEYYLDNEYYETVPMTANVWAGANSVELKVADLKQYPGYTYSKANPTLPANVTDGQVVKAYYVKDPSQMVKITYTLKFVDEAGVSLAADVVKEQSVWAGTPYVTVSSSDVKFFSGMTIKEITLSDGTVTTLPNKKVVDGEVLTVVYMKDPNAKEDITFDIAYYKDGSLTADFTESKTVSVMTGQMYSLKQSEVDANKFVGQKIDTTRTFFPISVGNGGTAHIYFVKDSSQYKSIYYTINYYLDNVFKESETVTVNDVLISENAADVVDTTKTYYGYNRVTPALSGKAANGDLFKVYYVKDTSITKSAQYTIRYHFADWQDPDNYTYDPSVKADDVITRTVWAGETQLDVLAADLPDLTQPMPVGSDTWMFNASKSNVPGKVDINGYVDLYYYVKAQVDVDITAKVTWTSKLKGNDFDFIMYEVGDPSKTPVAVGINKSTGMITFSLTVPLSTGIIGTTKEYYVVYDGPNASNPARPDTTLYKVKAQVVLNSNGIPTLKVTSYEKTIAFAMR